MWALGGQGSQHIMQSVVVLELVGTKLQELVVTFAGILLSSC